MSLPIAIVAAVARNGAIGLSNTLPWHLKRDLDRFRDLTTGHPIVMGRATYQSIGRPLPGRETVVLSRDPSFAPKGAWVAPSWDQALSLATELGQSLNATMIMAVGGTAIFELALENASRIYLTVVDHDVEADTYFPALDLTQFDVENRTDHPADEQNDYPITFLDLKRKTD